MTLKPSWFTEQLELVAKEVDTWPDWAKRAAGVSPPSASPTSSVTHSSELHQGSIASETVRKGAQTKE